MREALRSDHAVVAKWASWAGDRCIRAGAASPRTLDAGGRSLQRSSRRGWERADEAVSSLRAGRRQRPEPKLLSWACMVLATGPVLIPVTPSPLHVGASCERRPVSGRRWRSPASALTSSTGCFRRDPREVAAPHVLFSSTMTTRRSISSTASRDRLGGSRRGSGRLGPPPARATSLRRVLGTTAPSRARSFGSTCDGEETPLASSSPVMSQS